MRAALTTVLTAALPGAVGVAGTAIAGGGGFTNSPILTALTIPRPMNEASTPAMRTCYRLNPDLIPVASKSWVEIEGASAGRGNRGFGLKT